MKFFGLIVLAGCLGWGIYVRFAPSTVGRWHVVPPVEAKRWSGGVVEVIAAGEDLFAALVQVAGAAGRTRVLAGSLEEGRVTFVTRSKYWGFPDYTTIEAGAGVVRIYARLRFGRSDSGVNAARVRVWVQRAQAIQN